MTDIETEQLGLATELMCVAPRLLRHPLSFVRNRVRPAIQHGYIQFAFDDAGSPLAFWTWAFLAMDVVHRVSLQPYYVLHQSEWDEGSSLWILDLVAPYGHARDVMHFIARSFFKEYKRAYSVRRTASGRVKLSCWIRSRCGPRLASKHALRFELPDSSFAPSRSAWKMVRQAE